MKNESRQIQRTLKIFLAVVLCLLLAVPAPVSAASASIKLNASKKTLTVGGSVKLTATVTGKSKTVTWKSSKTSVATVSKNGEVTAKKVGTATITAKANGKTAKCVITVKKATWASAYATWLAKYPSKTSSRYYDASYNPSDKSYVNDFLLCDLTSDGTPELITYTYVNFRWYIVRIYTCQSGKVKQLKLKDGENAELNDKATANGSYSFYICKKGHLHNNFISGMASSETIYKYSGGKLCAYLTMDLVGTNSANAVYKKNGSTISKAKYSSLTSGCTSLSVKAYANTTSNRTLLKKGKCKTY